MAVIMFVEEPNKTASWLGIKGFSLKKLLNLEEFKNVWRAGREVIDAIGAAYGLDVKALRADFRKSGVDADKYSRSLESALAQAGFTVQNAASLSADEANAASEQATEDARVTPSWLVIAGVVLGCVLLMKGVR